MAESIWVDALERKQEALKEANINLSLDIHSLDHFEASLDSIANKYGDKKLTKLVQGSLGPHLEHVVSFTKALSAASPQAPPGSIVWGGLAAMIESSCRFSRSLDDILAEIAELQASLPLFSEHFDLCRDDPGLQYCLRDLFEDYIDFCICIVKYTRTSPTRHILRNLVSSSSIKGLQSVKNSMEKHKQRFAQRAEIAIRRSAQRHHSDTMKLQDTMTKEFSSLRGSLSQDSNVPQSPPLNSLALGRVQSNASAASATPLLEPVWTMHNIHWKRNTMLTGRDKELRQLHEYLNLPHRSSEAVSCSVHGIGGVGKTQLALEYTYHYRNCYEAIFWLRTQSSVVLSESLVSIANKLNIIDDVNEARRTSRILDWLESTEKRWLLVMDNLEEIDNVAAIWPTSSRGGGSIIITTQKPCDVLKWADYDIPLKPLSADVGSQLLLSQIPGDSVEEDDGTRGELAREIATSVGGLPLWLNALGGFIAQSQCTLSECIEIYKSSLDPMDQAISSVNWMYDKAPSAVFDLAFSRLSPDARTLLHLLAFLNPDGVPENMLMLDEPVEELAVLDSSSRQRFFSAIASLRSSQLIKREGPRLESYLTTHRSIQTAMLRKLDLDLEQRAACLRNTCFLLRRVFPRPSPLQQPESDKWPLIQTYLPQLMSLERAFLRAHPPMEGSMELAVLLSDVGLNVWDRGLGEEARSLLLTADKVLDSIGCDEWAMERSDIHVLLGIMTDTVGITQRAEGLRYRESALRIRKHYIESIPRQKLTLEEEIRYHNTLTDLACSYQQFNRFDEVETICEEVLVKYRSWGSEEEYPYEFAKYYHHMAFVLASRGETRKAVEYAARATDLKKLGAFGLVAVLYQADCAVMRFLNGEADLATSEFEKVLQHEMQTLGPSNPLTIQTLLALGAIHYFKKDLEKAEGYLRDVMTQCRKKTVPHEAVVRAKFYMYLVLRDKDSSDTLLESSHLAEEAEEGLLQLLPLDYPEFLKDRAMTDPIVFDYLVPWTYRIAVETRLASERTD